MKKILITIATLGSVCFAQDYNFTGKHFIASYYDCSEEALLNLKQLANVMEEASFSCGAQVLQQINHEFPGGGFSQVLLLSESHASIHTYPEHKACFVDLFTCGTSCDSIAFDKALTEYLKPGKKAIEVIHRD